MHFRSVDMLTQSNRTSQRVGRSVELQTASASTNTEQSNGPKLGRSG